MKTKKDRAWTPLQNTDPQKTPAPTITVSTTTRQLPATELFTEQVNATADRFSQRSAAIAKVQSDWQKCLDWAEWLSIMERVVIDLAAGGAIKTEQFNAIERFNLVLAEAMVWVTSEARQLELA